MISCLDRVPARLVIGIMMFSSAWVNYMMRVNMSVNIIAMVTPISTGTSVKSECEALENRTYSLNTQVPDDPYESLVSRELRLRDGPVTFDWTAQQQGYILSSYFWSYAVTCFIGGRVVELVGPRMLLFSTTLLSAVLTIFSPQAAKVHYLVLVAFRFIIGLSSGFLFPVLNDLMSRWAPPHERSKYVAAMLGGAIGTVFTWSLTGILIERMGWDYAFYIPGLMIVAWCFAWWFLVYDSPVEHPRISLEEKQYILNAIGNKVKQASKNRATPPYKQILTSFPFLAMIIYHYGNAWGVYFIMTAAPKYVSTALGYRLSSTGVLSSLPYLARMISSFLFASLGDKLVGMNIVRVIFIRKFFGIFSHIIPGLLLISLTYLGCKPVLSIALITCSLGINGAATLTNLVNHQDLAPNYAATVFGIANGIGNTAGFLTPLVTAHFTKTGNGFAEWRPVFLTGGLLYIATAVYFMFFGTADTQPWNYINMDAEENREKKPNEDTKDVSIKV